MAKNEFFIDRPEYQDILEKRILHLKDGYRQNVAFIGDELVGKTSLIFRFLKKFYDNRIILLYLEARPESLSIFAKRFIGVLLYNFLLPSGLSLKEDLDFLIQRSSKYIPHTVLQIKSILSDLEKRKKNTIIMELFSLCETIYQETQKPCVIILDEFHNLESLGVKNLYADWSKLLVLQKHTLYIITSSLKFKTKEILSKNLSLLFGNFEIVNVEPFGIKASEEYLSLRLAGLNTPSAIKNFIIYFTGGYPFYLGLISDFLLKSGQPDLINILEELLFESSGILNQRFSNYLKRFLDTTYSQEYISILYLISSGHNKIKDIAHLTHKQQKELTLRINHLLEVDAVIKRGDFLQINDRVFSFWLKFVSQGRLQSLTFDAKSQKILFRNDIEKMLQEFLKNCQKSITERTMELLRLFENEIVQIERKKLRLTHFKEIKPLELSCGRFKDGIIGRADDKLWLIAFKKDTVTEEDVAAFAKECKKYRNKRQNKIIVAFEDLEANARLKALEEKIWTWDIAKLNQIFDLFSKPSVIA
ncbi:MAG: hypothetical protein A2166_00165 [Omnitrophica WOR_2 bacterium RBG_13_41_10]|nr:MAG: hypothetical protein A2166_00165 [Omnitrophica WOR_2 bacterium RBG_13_41_10]